MHDECGFLLSAELMLVLSLSFTLGTVGFAVIRDSLVNEVNDLAHALGAVDQTFNIPGIEKSKAAGVHAGASGFGFDDDSDDCDCNLLDFADVDGKPDPSNGPPIEGLLP